MSLILSPFRTIGLVCGDLPFSFRQEKTDAYIACPIDNYYQTYTVFFSYYLII